MPFLILENVGREHKSKGANSQISRLSPQQTDKLKSRKMNLVPKTLINY